jgi:hypothetical protein
MTSTTQEFKDALRNRGIDPSRFETVATDYELNGQTVPYYIEHPNGSFQYHIGRFGADKVAGEFAEEIKEGSGSAVDFRRAEERIGDIDFSISGGADPSDVTLADIDEELTTDNVTTIRSGGDETINFGNRTRLSLTFDDASGEASTEFWDALQELDDSTLSETTVADIGQDAALVERREESIDRQRARESARDAAEAAGVDLDEFGIDARADGSVILQDRETGQTRTIDADTDGLGAALEAETSGGEFVADAADPAAGTASSGGLGARAAGAVVLLFGAIAAAMGWLS